MATDSIGRKITEIVKLSTIEWDRICERVRNGEGTAPQIARLEGLNNDRTLRRQCRKRGIEYISRVDEAMPFLEQIVELYYDKEMSIATVAEELNLTRKGVKKALVDSGYKIKECGEALRSIKRGSTEESRLIELYKTTSLEDLEVIMGITRASLARTLKRNGVKLRKRGQHISRSKQ